MLLIQKPQKKHEVIILDKSTNDEHLAQALQTYIRQIAIGITFLKGFH